MIFVLICTLPVRVFYSFTWRVGVQLLGPALLLLVLECVFLSFDKFSAGCVRWFYFIHTYFICEYKMYNTSLTVPINSSKLTNVIYFPLRGQFV